MKLPTTNAPLSGEKLRTEHAHLDRLFDGMIARFAGGDWRDCDAAWDDFVRQVEAHMRYEEENLLGVFACSRPAAAAVVAQIRDEHRLIRELLNELGMSLQLHLVRAELIEELVSALRAHAQLESETLYPWLMSQRAAAPEAVADGTGC